MIDYTALREEIEQDPEDLGYAPFVESGADQAIANLLNEPREGITVRRDDIDIGELYAAIDVTDYPELRNNPTQGEISEERRNLSWLTGLGSMQHVRLIGENTVDTPVLSNLKRMFPSGSATIERVEALAERDGSRAEQLFGANTHIGHLDVARALRGGE